MFGREGAITSEWVFHTRGIQLGDPPYQGGSSWMGYGRKGKWVRRICQGVMMHFPVRIFGSTFHFAFWGAGILE